MSQGQKRRKYASFFFNLFKSQLSLVVSNPQSARTYLNARDDLDRMNPGTSYTSLPSPAVDLIRVFSRCSRTCESYRNNHLHLV